MPTSNQTSTIPEWLKTSEDYTPSTQRNSFVLRSLLSVTSTLRYLRLDDGAAAKFSASAPVKLLFVIGLILLNALSTNFAFTLFVLALVVVRACIFPAEKIARIAAVSVPAAALSFLIMLPATFLGQPHSALLIAAKTFASASALMEMALSTPFYQLTGGLRVFHVPNLFIMTIDLALKNIVDLGNVAIEVLTSLKLRSVGANKASGVTKSERTSIGGVAGVVFLKSTEAAKSTYAAMSCRGFDGNYTSARKQTFKAIDIAWVVLFCLIVAAFAYLQGAVS